VSALVIPPQLPTLVAFFMVVEKLAGEDGNGARRAKKGLRNAFSNS